MPLMIAVWCAPETAAFDRFADHRYLRQSAGMKAKGLKQAIFPVLLLIVLAWYVNGRAHVPAASTVNGVYSNSCCSNILLRDGIMIVGTSRVPFQLENMKFGLTAYPAQQILVRNGRVEAFQDPDPGPLSFSDSGTVVTVCGDRLCKHVYPFRRDARPPAPSE